MVYFEAPGDAEFLIAEYLTGFLPSLLIQEDWESAVETAEAVKKDFGRLDSLLLDTDSDDWRQWTSEQLAAHDVAAILTSLASLDRAEAWQVAYSLHYVVGDYYGCLLDDDKQLGHLLRRHAIKSEKVLWELDDDDLYKHHIQSHARDFGHESGLL